MWRMSLRAVLGAAVDRVEDVDDALAAQLDLDGVRREQSELDDLAVGAVFADERVPVHAEMHEHLADEVDARRAG